MNLISLYFTSDSSPSKFYGFLKFQFLNKISCVKHWIKAISISANDFVYDWRSFFEATTLSPAYLVSRRSLKRKDVGIERNRLGDAGNWLCKAL